MIPSLVTLPIWEQHGAGWPNRTSDCCRKGPVLLLLFLVVLVLWLMGFGFQVGGSLIHLLLIVALILLIVRLAQGRRLT